MAERKDDPKEVFKFQKWFVILAIFANIGLTVTFTMLDYQNLDEDTKGDNKMRSNKILVLSFSVANLALIFGDFLGLLFEHYWITQISAIFMIFMSLCSIASGIMFAKYWSVFAFNTLITVFSFDLLKYLRKVKYPTEIEVIKMPESTTTKVEIT